MKNEPKVMRCWYCREDMEIYPLVIHTTCPHCGVEFWVVRGEVRPILTPAEK